MAKRKSLEMEEHVDKGENLDEIVENGQTKKNGEITLEAKMSLLNGVTVIVGSIIGSGIFLTPSSVLQFSGSPMMSLVIWTLSGIFSMIGAYCYAELGCMIKRSGADYAYIMETFGSFAAFIRLWIECMIVRPCSQAIVALTFSTNILKPIYPDCDPPDNACKLLAAFCICTLAFVNCYNVKWATKVQDIFTYAKLLALVIIIGTGIYQLCIGHTQYFTFKDSIYDVSSLGKSFYYGLFAYNGWNYLNFIIEELKDPVKNLPRAIGIAIIIVIIIYIMTNVAFITTLSPHEIMNSKAVAVIFAERLYGPMAWIIPIFVALSTFGAVNGILLTSSRLFYAGACERQMPEILTMIQVTKLTPAPAVICMAILSLFYLIPSNIGFLIECVSFAVWLAIGVSVLCIVWLRVTQPNLPRPIKVNLFFPIVYILVTLLITVIPIYSEPFNTGIGCVMILSAVPVYFLFIAWKNKPKFFVKSVVCTTKFIQKLMIVVGKAKPAQV